MTPLNFFPIHKLLKFEYKQLMAFLLNMQKRLEGLTEAELQVLLEQVEEEKRRTTGGEQVNRSN